MWIDGPTRQIIRISRTCCVDKVYIKTWEWSTGWYMLLPLSVNRFHLGDLGVFIYDCRSSKSYLQMQMVANFGTPEIFFFSSTVWWRIVNHYCFKTFQTGWASLRAIWVHRRLLFPVLTLDRNIEVRNSLKLRHELKHLLF